MFEQPQSCIVELFGHQVIAGRVSEQTIGGQSFVRVDVPEVGPSKAFTKFYGSGAIYAMTPVDEPTMMAAVKFYQVQPIEVFRLTAPALSSLNAKYEDSGFGDDGDDEDNL